MGTRSENRGHGHKKGDSSWKREVDGVDSVASDETSNLRRRGSRKAVDIEATSDDIVGDTGFHPDTTAPASDIAAAYESAKSTVGNLAHVLVDSGKARVLAAKDQVRSKAMGYMFVAVHRIRERPIASIAGALALGWLFGRVRR